MKRNLFATAIVASLVLAGCSNSEFVESYQSDADAISFGTTLSKTTRATPINQFEDGDQFFVDAYYTQEKEFPQGTDDPNFMRYQDVTLGATGWTYSPIKYWPNNVTSTNQSGKVSFFAHAPALEDESGTTIKPTYDTGEPVITYTIPTTDLTKQQDILWAVNPKTGLPYLDMTKQTTDETIMFDFKHALARIGFEVKLGGDIIAQVGEDAAKGETTVTLANIEIGGFDKTGNPSGVFFEKGELSLKNTIANVPAWKTTGVSLNPQNYKFESTDFDCVELPTNTTGILFENVTGTQKNATYTLINKNANYLMIIPQTFKTAGEVKICVTYDVVTIDDKVGGNSTVRNIQTVSLPSNTKFVNGKAYKYVLTIGINSVKMEGVVTDWDDNTVTVPIDVTNPF